MTKGKGNNNHIITLKTHFFTVASYSLKCGSVEHLHQYHWAKRMVTWSFSWLFKTPWSSNDAYQSITWNKLYHTCNNNFSI